MELLKSCNVIFHVLLYIKLEKDTHTKYQEELREGLTGKLLVWVVCKIGIIKDM
jgi:hypothetical protein